MDFLFISLLFVHLYYTKKAMAGSYCKRDYRLELTRAFFIQYLTLCTTYLSWYIFKRSAQKLGIYPQESKLLRNYASVCPEA